MLAHFVFFSLSGSGSLLLCFTFNQSSALELREALLGVGRKGWESRAQPAWPESKSSLGCVPGGGPSLLSLCARGRRDGGRLDQGLAEGEGWRECATCRGTQGGVP